MIFAKFTITNSYNDNVFVEWKVFETEEECNKWKAEQEEGVKFWNSPDNIGAQSIRFGELQRWENGGIAYASVKELSNMPLHIFKKALEFC